MPYPSGADVKVEVVGSGGDFTAELVAATGSGEFAFTGDPPADATKAMLRLGNALVGGDADGTFLGINADAGFAGDFANWQVNGTTLVRFLGDGTLQMGTPPLTGYAIEIQSAANTATAAGIRIRNTADTSVSTAAAATLTVQGGSSGATASGSLVAYGDSYVDVTLRNRVALTANSDAAGLILRADNASQDIRMFVGTLGEQMRFLSTGQFQIGLATAAARLMVAGRTDEIQGRVRAHSTQTNPIFEVEASNGTTKYLRVMGSTAGAGRLVGTALNSAIADGDLSASQYSFYLNEAGNTLTVKVKYADGSTVKTGTIALT